MKLDIVVPTVVSSWRESCGSVGRVARGGNSLGFENCVVPNVVFVWFAVGCCGCGLSWELGWWWRSFWFAGERIDGGALFQTSSEVSELRNFRLLSTAGVGI